MPADDRKFPQEVLDTPSSNRYPPVNSRSTGIADAPFDQHLWIARTPNNLQSLMNAWYLCYAEIEPTFAPTLLQTNSAS